MRAFIWQRELNDLWIYRGFEVSAATEPTPDPTPEPTAEPTQEPTPGTGIRGDANRDGKVNSSDAADVLRFIVGLMSAEDIDLAAAKVTSGEGNLTSADAAKILRFVVGLEPVL